MDKLQYTKGILERIVRSEDVIHEAKVQLLKVQTKIKKAEKDVL